MSPEEESAPTYSPKIVKTLPKKTITQDKQVVKFEVKVTGNPRPQTRWLKEGREIKSSEEFVIENYEDGTSVLILNDVYPDDTGEIKFEAYNPLGVAETTTYFVVEGNKI